MLINYKTTLIEKRQLTADIFFYRFKLVVPTAITFIPGQYLILFVPQENGEKARRLYSIASPNILTNEFQLLVKLVPNGCASSYFEKLQINNECEFQGPAGMFVLRESQRDKIGLVTGTGYAPIRSMLLSQPMTKNFTLFLGVPTYKDTFLFEELKQLSEKNSYFKFYMCLSREQNLDMIPETDKKYFLLGRITNGFEQKILNTEYSIVNSDFYLCSGREVVESLKEYLYQKGAQKEQVYFEKF